MTGPYRDEPEDWPALAAKSLTKLLEELRASDQRDEIEASPSWLHRLLGPVLVTRGVWRRYVIADFNGVLHDASAPTLDDPRDALTSLQRARDRWSLEGYDCAGLHIIDRRTGRRFSPSPEKIADLLEDRCPICRMWGDEPCDVGLHG